MRDQILKEGDVIMPNIELKSGVFCKVDESDFKKLSSKTWRLDRNGYARRNINKNGRKITVLMHMDIISCPKGMCVDHINRDKLDNRKINLRICTTSQNAMNTHGRSDRCSKYKGVFIDRDAGKWRAKITANKKVFYLGSFNNQEQAALAYNKAALKYHGEFAFLNNIDGVHG